MYYILQLATNAIIHSLCLRDFRYLLRDKDPVPYLDVKLHAIVFHFYSVPGNTSSISYGLPYYLDTVASEHKHGRDGVRNWSAGSKRKQGMTKELVKCTLIYSHVTALVRVSEELGIPHAALLDKLYIDAKQAAKLKVREDLEWNHAITKSYACKFDDASNMFSCSGRNYKLHKLLTNRTLTRELLHYMRDTLNVRPELDTLCEGYRQYNNGTI